jgi:hypothetical protein
MHNKIKDLAVAAALLGVSVFALVNIGATPEQSRIASAATLNYASLPKAYGWALVILVGIYMVTIFVDMYKHWRTEKSPARANLPAVGKNRESDQPMSIWPNKVVLFRLAGTLFMLVSYVFSLEYVHFMIATTVFLFCMFLIFGQKSLIKVSVVSIAGGAAFYLLFIKALNLPI